ncbi:MAG: D-alanyl-D-alanine carboxypeptidase [Alphaproteobacteria bacterium]|nr:D-alanyl-D-alanine carboxypeptidase [Alphaproteobacteria bacterium]MBR1649486.1 D-alanyl-D-alanine carboxypeptidase [Alphaproteobacteria bacterium]
MVKLFRISLFAVLLLWGGSALGLPKTSSGIAIDIKTGEIISSENPDAIRYPASLTKLMTLYLTFEALEKGKLKMNTPLKVSKYAANREPSKLGVKPGQTISVETAIHAVIVKSANDCAVVLAEALAKNEAEFALKMTDKAHKLGMKHTVFKNASGLNNNAQVTTARDMAVLGAAMYKHFPKYYHLFSLQKFSYQGKNFYTHNHVLKRFKGSDGMKTGYLACAGYNIVTSAKRGEHRILAVAMGHKSIKERDDKVIAMMDKGLKKIALNDEQKAHKVMAKLDVPKLISAEMKSTKEIKKELAKGEWGIQIGAFRNYAKARSYAFSLKQKNPELKPYPIDVEAAQSDMAVVYRSKITNFSKKDAQELCDRLKKENKPCIVVKNQSLAMQ